MPNTADHHWWMFFFHDWEAVAVRDRFQPFRDGLSGEIRKDVGSVKTDILYRCACGKVKVKSVRGAWKLEEVRA